MASPPLVELDLCVGHAAIDRVGQLPHLAGQRQALTNRGAVGRHRCVNLQQQSVGISVRACHGGVCEVDAGEDRRWWRSDEAGGLHGAGQSDQDAVRFGERNLRIGRQFQPEVGALEGF